VTVVNEVVRAHAGDGASRVHRDAEDVLAVDALQQGSPRTHPQSRARGEYTTF
jgi:hypothetical protein